MDATAGDTPPPSIDKVADLVTAYQATQLLAVFIELRLDALIQQPSRTATDLADATGTDVRLLTPCLDALCEIGLLERKGKAYTCGELGALVRSEDVSPFRALVMHHASTEYESWGHLLETLRSGNRAPSLYQRGDVPASFDEGNDAMTRAQRAPVVAASFTWSTVRTVVDVGGGLGGVLLHLLREQPHLHGTLVEMPHVADEAARRAATSGLEGRFDAVAGSFFDPLPRGHDVYLLVHVLLNWPDDEAVRLLQNCRAAMPDDSRLLIVEPIGGLSDPNPRLAISTRLLCGGMVRELADHMALLARADLRTARAVRAGPEAVLEVVKAR